MKEFDYLVSWVKELCDKVEKAQFESALLEAEGGQKGLPTVWYYISCKISDKLNSQKGKSNPRYLGFLDLCKKNPTLRGPYGEEDFKNFLGFQLDQVMYAKYPEHDAAGVPTFRHPSSFIPWDQESNETVQRENDQPMPMTNFLKDKFDEVF
jgi:hypothetical protein